MNYNFDEVIDRSNSDCSKIENLKPLFGREDIVPLWVAIWTLNRHRNYPCLMKRVEHELFGYTVQSSVF